MSITGLDLRRRALFALTDRLPCRLIPVARTEGGPLKPYLERYKLFDLPGDRRVYLHRFVSSDPERGYHNHPWDSVSFPLVGSYLERIFHPSEEKTQVVGAGTYNTITQEKFHRVELLTPDAWTLFFRSGTSNGWGFIFRDKTPGNNIWQSWIDKPENTGSRWVFSGHTEQTDEVGGWEGIPLGKDADRQPFRAYDRGHWTED